MPITILIITMIAAGFFVFLSRPIFGQNPSGNELEKIKRSPNYRDGKFQNISETPMMRKGVNFLKLLFDFFKKIPGTEPVEPIKTLKRKLETETSKNPVITWFGHSSYLVQYEGFSLLVDPVFCHSPSPVEAVGPKSFNGSEIYGVNDLPEINAILLTHDHYDHLDYEFIISVKDRVPHFYTSYGVGSHLVKWGVAKEKITELDWWDETALPQGGKLIATPARHFSGRGIVRYQTLWSGFVLASENWKIYLGGDSGYDGHFKKIGEKYGPFDLALLECGQYNQNWPYIHMMPEETVQAAADLNAKVLMPVHWGKFKLALHAWKEPVQRAVAAAEKRNLPFTTPMIGEKVILNEVYPNSHWWEQTN